MQEENILLGYVRKSQRGGKIKLSINENAFKLCQTYKSSDGETWIPCEISIHALLKILNGEKYVSSIVQFQSQREE